MKFKVVKRCQEDLGSIHGLLKSFLPFARKRMGFNRPPTIFFQSDQGNAQKLLGKTAHYEPATGHITVYVTGRHPKDVLRSLSHELVHHGQNCRGEFGHTPDTAPGYAQTDDHMRKMEEEAYKVGNLCFRDWEDNVKSGKIRVSIPLKENLLREKEEKYTVVSGDTLSGIAGNMYGDIQMWPIIYKVNKEAIGGNPDMIQPGTELIIPDTSAYNALSQKEIDSIYALSSFYEKSASGMTPVSGGGSGPALSISETDALFPVKAEDRPGRLSSPFGMRGALMSLARQHAPDGPQPNRALYKKYSKSRKHGGIDVPLPIGTDIVAPVSGKISAINPNSSSGGKIMYLKGEDGRRYEFMHLDSFVASRGQGVERGQVIAKSGNTGPSTGPHLHFQVRERGRLIDPMTLYRSTNIQSISEWKNEELNKLLLEKFNLGVIK
jgi:murein DD-endopeptidase MepM/ murein hydrolase activator NlpD